MTTAHAVEVSRRRDGTIVVRPGKGPLPRERRVAQVLQVSALAVVGVSGVSLVAWLGLSGITADVVEVGAMLALIAAGILPVFRRFVRPQQVEIDWRREEIRQVGRRGTVTLDFSAILQVECASRWNDDNTGLLFDVTLVGSADRIHVGAYDDEESARGYAAELRELLGLGKEP